MTEGGSASAGPSVAAVILADGDTAGEPSAFVRVLDRPLLALCAETLDACPGIQGFVVVAPPGMEGRASEVARVSPKFLAVVPGEATRRESVAAGVAAVGPHLDVVVCHEVARALASPELFDDVLQALNGADGAVPQVPVGDTVKRVAGGFVKQTIPREGLGMVQTPQAFRCQALLAATRHPTGGRDGPTEVASLVVAAGFRVATVPGDPANLALRSVRDVRLAQRLLAERLSQQHDR
jgi:2-C-methyl-D-erythritol 4-phosphate cytidylyltransferase